MALRGRSVGKSADRFLVHISVCSPQIGSQVRILVSGPRDETEKYLKKSQSSSQDRPIIRGFLTQKNNRDEYRMNTLMKKIKK